MVENLPVMQETWVQFLGQEDSLEKYCCLENPMERGAWQATVHRVTNSQTRPKRLSLHPVILISVLYIHSPISFVLILP